MVQATDWGFVETKFQEKQYQGFETKFQEKAAGS
jgi:hypothetical protein